MECFYCKGKMKRGRTSYSLNRGHYHLIIDEVPAFICSQCGEVYFEEKEVDSIQDLISEIDKRAKKIQQFKLEKV